MSLLDAVDWPALLERIDATPDRFGATVERLDSRASGRRALEDAVATASPLPAGDVWLVARWIAHTAPYLDLVGNLDQRHHDDQAVDTAAAEAAPGQPVQGRTAGLTVDAALAGRLPWLDLADDLARQFGSLDVVLVDLVPHRAAGVAFLAAGRIALDRGLLEDRLRLRTVWGHELGHMLDPMCASRPAYQRERFADAVADLLPQYAPTRLTAARPLLDHAEAMTEPPITDPRLPDPGLPSALAALALVRREFASQGTTGD